MEFLSHYGMFLLETVTLVVAILIVAAGLMAIASKGKSKDKIVINKINDKYTGLAKMLNEEILTKEAFKRIQKELKKKLKIQKSEKKPRKRIFVIRFAGDIKATAVEFLREEITAALTVSTPEDEILVILESGGGIVHGYGLGASQLDRIRQMKIPLTVAVDKVAASGGYLMACVADTIIAAPFSIIGSIGVIAQIPNFNRLLKKNNIDFEQVTAGKFKRTLTLFGENTEKARDKLQEDLEEVHQHFKEFVITHRPQVDIEKVATGEHWLGQKAKELKLVDILQTSDDYLLERHTTTDLFEIKYIHKKGISEKLSNAMQTILWSFT